MVSNVDAQLSKRALGHTGMDVSLLSLGTVKFGRTTGVKYPTAVTLPTDAEAVELLAEARALGINLIDTAPAYGTSEERVGGLLKGQRDDWLICTKVGENFDGEHSSYDFTAHGCEQSITRSLRKLGTDHLDIVLIHSDGNDLDILQKSDALETLTRFKDAGKVRAIGISHKTVAGAELALDLGVDVIMATLNPGYTGELEIIHKAGASGTGVLIKKALDSGHGSADGLGFVAAQAGVSSIVVGTTNIEHLAANAAAVMNS